MLAGTAAWHHHTAVTYFRLNPIHSLISQEIRYRFAIPLLGYIKFNCNACMIHHRSKVKRLIVYFTKGSKERELKAGACNTENSPHNTIN